MSDHKYELLLIDFMQSALFGNEISKEMFAQVLESSRLNNVFIHNVLLIWWETCGKEYPIKHLN